MRIEKIGETIEKISPLYTQESWDNSGFQIKFEAAPVSKVLVALEITDDVIDEACALEAEAVVTHHPMFFNSLNNIYDNDVTGNYIVKLIQNNINVYASHTPFDKCDGGNNDYLAALLGLSDIRKSSDDEGFLRIGKADRECNIRKYIDKVSECIDVDKRFFSFAGDLDFNVKNIGICTGAGVEFARSAFDMGCNLFITGDLKYHDAQNARESGMNILDIGHYGSEKIFITNMANYLRRNTDLNVFESKADLNPFILI